MPNVGGTIPWPEILDCINGESGGGGGGGAEQQHSVVPLCFPIVNALW